MTKNDIDTFTRNVLCTEFEADNEALTDDTNLFEELDLDSIDAVDLVVRLQKEYSVSLKPEDFKDIRTYGDLIAVLCKTIGVEE